MVSPEEVARRPIKALKSMTVTAVPGQAVVEQVSAIPLSQTVGPRTGRATLFPLRMHFPVRMRAFFFRITFAWRAFSGSRVHHDVENCGNGDYLATLACGHPALIIY